MDGGTPTPDLSALLANLDQLDETTLRELETLVDELETRTWNDKCHDDLIEFCKHMQADYKVGAHHRRLADLLMEIEAGHKDRICVSVPPRHGKSQLVSIYYAAWYLGRNPDHKVMLVSHTGDLAVDFGRKVRNLIDSDIYQDIFPGVTLAADSKSAGRWSTNHGGEFFAAGVGAALAGRGAHLLLVDDPHSEQDVLAGNYDVFDKAYQWFAYGARTRLMPGGKIAIIHCMTGDTPVLRPDGTETPLQDIRPGDMVMSYDGEALVPRKVLNWANQGPDAIFTITLNDSKKVRANARHPFLVERDGIQTWTKVQDLKPGDSLVSINAGVWGKQSQDIACVTDALKKLPGVEKVPQLVNTIRTQGLHAAKWVAHNRQCVRDYADHITMSSTGLHTKTQCAPTNSGITTYSASMASASPNTTLCWNSRITDAVSVMSTKMSPKYLSGGARVRRLQSIIATILGKSARSCATVATSLYRHVLTKVFSSGLLSTSEITKIYAHDFEEDVFDIQVEGTENFVANGVLSHNTRWHQNDLIGQVVRDMSQDRGSDVYEVFEFPAILETCEQDPETGKDIIVEKALWPEFFDLPALKRTKASMPHFQWSAQYQQNPTGEEAAIVKREWWNKWVKERPPSCEYIIMSLDAAAEGHNRADFTALTTWGVFVNEEVDSVMRGEYNIILLDSVKERMEFPELKRMAMAAYKQWEPDAFIVEKKSSGTALYQEMRRSGLIVQEYTPHRGTGDKMARLNSVADIISSGLCWVPQTRWAEEVVEEIAGFPFVSNDDLVDSSVMALMRFRQGGFIRLPSDEWQDDEHHYREKVEYY